MLAFANKHKYKILIGVLLTAMMVTMAILIINDDKSNGQTDTQIDKPKVIETQMYLSGASLYTGRGYGGTQWVDPVWQKTSVLQLGFPFKKPGKITSVVYDVFGADQGYGGNGVSGYFGLMYDNNIIRVTELIDFSKTRTANTSAYNSDTWFTDYVVGKDYSDFRRSKLQVNAIVLSGNTMAAPTIDVQTGDQVVFVLENNGGSGVIGYARKPIIEFTIEL